MRGKDAGQADQNNTPAPAAGIYLEPVANPRDPPDLGGEVVDADGDEVNGEGANTAVDVEPGRWNDAEEAGGGRRRAL